MRTLSSDEFEGRGPGTHGETLSIAYISRAFAALGLEPGVPGAGGLQASYLQDVPLITATEKRMDLDHTISKRLELLLEHLLHPY